MVMLGMFALNPVGITGSIVQQLNHGISTGALFLLVGVVYERRHTREISEYGGLSKVMPVYAAVFLIMTMSSIGLPALNGFIGELLILQGVFVASKTVGGVRGERRRAGRGLHALPLSADDVRQDREPEERAADSTSRHREFATFAPLLVLAVWMGIYPTPFLRRLETSVQHIIVAREPALRAGSTRSANCGGRRAGPPRIARRPANPARRRSCQHRRQRPCDVATSAIRRGAVRSRRQAARAWSTADASRNFDSATSTTSCRSSCSRPARCSC